ncbi:unnamed protein product [Paramecium primaurelia]|uniref:Tetratricopeptide repeat protein n=1 Tax=Paramecium primaurelia TaxID=5886 RepID=A0A8S1LDX8_PARPR|nr:unnamed protein product [Paramecium primaurelia]
MIEEEFIKLFQNNEVELQTIDQKQINQESIQESALRKIRRKELSNMLKDLSWDDRYEWLLYQKNKGNKLFYQQQYDRAIQVYDEMALALDLQNTAERNEIMKQDFQYPIIFNLALCYKKKKDYVRASQFYDMGIKMHPSPRYILRRGYFHFDIQDYDKVQSDLSLVTNINEYPDLQEDYYDLKQKLNEALKKDKELYQRMFQQNSQSDDEQQTKLSKLDQLYEWCKNQFSRIFGCRRLFEDDESDDDDESDPKKFLENK